MTMHGGLSHYGATHIADQIRSAESEGAKCCSIGKLIQEVVAVWLLRRSLGRSKTQISLLLCSVILLAPELIGLVLPLIRSLHPEIQATLEA